MRNILILIICLISYNKANAQLSRKTMLTKADSLRGSINENRDWWDALFYEITVTPNFGTKEIKASTSLKFMVINDKYISYQKNSSVVMQIDLSENLIIDSILLNQEDKNSDLLLNGLTKKLEFTREGNVTYIKMNDLGVTNKNENFFLTIFYQGKPQIANNPPWDGGWIWKKDKLGRPFVSVACQGLGASSWYPCKDHQSDEPNNGVKINIIVPDSLVAIGNGVFMPNEPTKNIGKTKSYSWQVKNPINTYNVVPYIGKYVNITDTFMGIKSKLNLNYWVIDYNRDTATKHFSQVKQMLRAFEYWFGAYPFYEDGYKLVESPHLGMEHQSNIAYGNKFNSGYLGRDLSGTGWGLKWDFIIVHESGHEWFANNITTADIADMWVHEGFTCYSETLFTEYYYGKVAGNIYCKGLRKNILNDRPIIGAYGVNKEGSGDMYYKAANMIHSIRQTINNDDKFRKMLIELNSKYYHSIVTSAEIENFINEYTGINFTGTFNQFLRASNIPTFEFEVKGRKLEFRYTDCIDEFDLPLTIESKTIHPTINWQTKRLKRKVLAGFTKENIENKYLLQALKKNKIEQ